MKASLRSIRIAPKKANIVAKIIRGMQVPAAQNTLERTNKKAARILEELLKSAVANAKHNENQDPSTLVIKSIIVNKAQAYHRGVPMARGRVRRMRKFLSHIDLVLGIEGVDDEKEASASKEAKDVKKEEVKEEKKEEKKAPAKPVRQAQDKKAPAKKKAETASKKAASSVKTTEKKAPKKATATTSTSKSSK